MESKYNCRRKKTIQACSLLMYELLLHVAMYECIEKKLKLRSTTCHARIQQKNLSRLII